MTVLPTYNILLVPHARMYLRTALFKSLAGRDPEADEKVTLLVMREPVRRAELTHESVYPIGLGGVIREVSPEGYIVIETGSRVDVESVENTGPDRLDVIMSRREDTDALSGAEYRRRAEEVKAALRRFSEQIPWGETARAYIEQWDTLGEVACAVSPWIESSNEERYAILAEDSGTARAEALERFVYENLEMIKLRREGDTERKEDYQKLYRENAIKKQLEYLQKELDELHPENVDDLRKLEVKIAESGMNDAARKEAEKLLNRLRQEGEYGAETGMIYNYLDFVTSLAWKKE